RRGDAPDERSSNRGGGAEKPGGQSRVAAVERLARPEEPADHDQGLPKPAGQEEARAAHGAAGQGGGGLRAKCRSAAEDDQRPADDLAPPVRENAAARATLRLKGPC